jgi:serine/threonine protein kinase
MELFKASLPHGKAEQDALLQRECGDDLELRRAVEALLHHDEAAERDLTPPHMGLQIAAAARAESGSGERSGDAPANVLELPPGTMLEQYKILSTIGEGGFGTVYAAEQSEPVRRRVAVKVLKAGLDTREVVARFEVERNALAMMDHRGIARVFDAGVTANGLPYFVMELISGVAVTKFCKQEGLDLPSRLRLFIALCEAVG